MTGRDLLAFNLRKWRATRQIAQERLAADANVDRAYLSKVERGEGNPTVDVLEKLAHTLGIDIADLFARPVANEPAPEPLKRGRRSSRA